MAPSFSHEPVLLHEVVAFARGSLGDREALVVDCTTGGAGHSSAILQACPNARLLGLDRDPAALAAARERLKPFGLRVQLRHGRFSELPAILAESGSHADFLLADLGVSSHQFDEGSRGFSLQVDAPLDMRMDPSSGVPVSELIAEMELVKLTEAISEFGEERYARRIASAIVAERPKTTLALANLVRRVVPRAPHERIHPATRTFQALRILANDELLELDTLLRFLPDVLADGGVGAIISFHSLEDRAVKHAVRAYENPCVCPPALPACVCGRKAVLQRLTKKAVVASDAEVESNPRSRSAKLRVMQRLARAA